MDEQKEAQEATQAEATEESAPNTPEVGHDYAQLIAEAKAEAEHDKEALKADYEQRLKERDDIIKSLIKGDAPATPQKTIADRLNEKRAPNLKKW